MSSLTSMQTYCPSASDFIKAYSNPTLFDQGWTINGGAGVATKAAFNLLGGYVEYDINFSSVHTGVNANIYTISPSTGGNAFSQNNYCDGAKTGASWCVEADWIESNGNCGGATTLHTVQGGGGGCNAGGCQTSYYYDYKPSFHMKVSYTSEGVWTTVHDGKTITGSNLSPSPQSSDWATLKDQYSKKGAVIYSSQWTGWVPLSSCGTYGDLGSSSFTVSNLKIYGSVVQGPAPRTCGRLVDGNETSV